MNITQRVKELDLPKGSFVVVGSGILNALRIRDAGDIDLVVTDEVYKRFEREGWQQIEGADQILLKRDVYDVCKSWYGKAVDELINTAQSIDGIPYLSLEGVYAWKKSFGREKDLKDLVLIDEYISRSL
jgi:hypothetical protein